MNISIFRKTAPTKEAENMAGNQSSTASNNAASRIARLSATFRAVRLEHLFAGITGGVVSTLVLHPLDLLKIRFAGNYTLLKRCKDELLDPECTRNCTYYLF